MRHLVWFSCAKIEASLCRRILYHLRCPIQVSDTRTAYQRYGSQFWRFTVYCWGFNDLFEAGVIPAGWVTVTGWHSQPLNTTFHFSLHSSSVKSDCLNTKACHFCPVSSVYLSVHFCHSRSTTRPMWSPVPKSLPSLLLWYTVSPALLPACLHDLSVFSGICPDYTSSVELRVFLTLLSMVIVLFFHEA